MAVLCAQDAPAAHIWPLSNSATPDVMNTSFGPRCNFSQWDFHDGIDLPAAKGTPCYAVADGVIHKEGPGGTDNYSSRHVILKEIQASGTTLYFQYLHLDAIALGLAEGATIAQGSYLGDVGNDDAAYSHLHFEVRRHGGNEDMSVHLLEELPYTPETTNFTAPVVDRFTRYNALMAGRLLFGAPSKEEGDLIRVEVDLMNGAAVVATRFVDFDDKATVSEGDTDDTEFSNDIAVEGYQSSDMPSDGFSDLSYGVLVRNLPANCNGLVARVKDLGGHVVTSVTVPVPVQAGVDVTATFETGSVDTGWSEVTSASGTGTTLYAEQSSARVGARGLTCVDVSNAEGTLQSAAVEYPLPAGRFEWTAEAWLNPEVLSLPVNGQAVYLLEFVDGASLYCAAYVRNASGALKAGLAGNKPGNIAGGIDSSYVVTPGEWHHWRLTVLRAG
ncbi:MAG: M23 family metallopeptidase, partial [bacterium]